MISQVTTFKSHKAGDYHSKYSWTHIVHAMETTIRKMHLNYKMNAIKLHKTFPQSEKTSLTRKT